MRLVGNEESKVILSDVTQNAVRAQPATFKLTKIVGKIEFQLEAVAPLPASLTGYDNRRFGKTAFHVAQAQTGATVWTDGVTDEDRRKSVAIASLLDIYRAYSLTELP